MTELRPHIRKVAAELGRFARIKAGNMINDPRAIWSEYLEPEYREAVRQAVAKRRPSGLQASPRTSPLWCRSSRAARGGPCASAPA